MGVKYLWTVLAPFCDRKPLYELQGKTVAVDLSCWICEAQNIAEYQVQPRMYLRNLYFRTCYLLLMDVNPVFVLEGKAPELKYDTISARNAIQFKGAKPKTDGVKTGKDRTRFHFVLRQCEEMLKYMGLACIKGKGEAESLCAYLNEDGLVDGCISQDSDCFAYGAQVVYRNFSISTQGVQAASGGAVDVYDIRKANQSLSFGRNKIIAMALLIGCDYTEGVFGIGKDSVLKFFETVSNDEVLDKLRSWRNNKKMYENYEKQLSDKNICTSCGHSGKIQGHTKNGCVLCKTTKGCDPFKYKDERLRIKNEVNMRNKAIQDPNFPNESLIKEFLDRKDDVKELDLTWKQPNIVKFMNFTTKFLQWEELYAFEKILPILTRWQCRNPELLKNEDKLKGVLKPDRIKKVRNPKGVPSFEIIWSDPGECFKGLVPENQLLENNVDMEKLWSTIEPQNLVETAYPLLVEEFKQSKIKPKKVSKRKKNKKDNIDEISDKLDNISITEPKPKKSRKPRAAKGQKTIENAFQSNPGESETTEPCLKDLNSSLKQLTIEKPEEKPEKAIESDVFDLDSSFKQMTIEKRKQAVKNKTKTLDSFVKKAVANSYKQKTDVDVQKFISDKEKSPKNAKNRRHSDIDTWSLTSSTPAKPTNIDLSINFDMSSFGDESDLELSHIIDDIVSRKGIKDKLKSIANKYVQDEEESVKELSSDEDLDDDNVVTSDDVIGHNPSLYEDLDTDDDVLDNNDKDKLNNLQNNNDRNLNKSDFVECASFFVSNLADENDLFEKTFNETFKNFQDSSGSDTEEYDYEVKKISGDENNGNNVRKNLDTSNKNCDTNDPSVKDVEDVICLSSDEESFCDSNYIPLYERLKSN